MGIDRDVLVWRLPRALRCASTAVWGGGLGTRHWVFNAEVGRGYHRTDIDQHMGELIETLELVGDGIGMLTAASVRRFQHASDGGVDADVTVGVSHPTWAASDESAQLEPPPGTVNIVAFLPIRLNDGALLNAIATATEAKSQALWEANIPATGTASDAVSILCGLDGEAERFGGPRSPWGARLARAVRHAVLAGALGGTT